MNNIAREMDAPYPDIDAVPDVPAAWWERHRALEILLKQGSKELREYANAVRADERKKAIEACAKVCEESGLVYSDPYSAFATAHAAEHIRALLPKETRSAAELGVSDARHCLRCGRPWEPVSGRNPLFLCDVCDSDTTKGGAK